MFFQKLAFNMHSHFLISSVYKPVFECPSLYCLPPERVKPKTEGEKKGCQLFKSPGITSIRREGSSNIGGGGMLTMIPVSLHLCDQKLQSAVRAQIPNILRTGSFFLCRLLQALCKLLQEFMHSCLSCTYC